MKRRSCRYLILSFAFAWLGLSQCGFGRNCGTQKVMIITVDDAVEPGLASYLERNIAIAKENQADLLILELDTPGGRVDAAQEIKRLLYDCGMETVALVKDQATICGCIHCYVL